MLKTEHEGGPWEYTLYYNTKLEISQYNNQFISSCVKIIKTWVITLLMFEFMVHDACKFGGRSSEFTLLEIILRVGCADRLFSSLDPITHHPPSSFCPSCQQRITCFHTVNLRLLIGLWCCVHPLKECIMRWVCVTDHFTLITHKLSDDATCRWLSGSPQFLFVLP